MAESNCHWYLWAFPGTGDVGQEHLHRCPKCWYWWRAEGCAGFLAGWQLGACGSSGEMAQGTWRSGA